jgi:hypothetical protein
LPLKTRKKREKNFDGVLSTKKKRSGMTSLVHCLRPRQNEAYLHHSQKNENGKLDKEHVHVDPVNGGFWTRPDGDWLYDELLRLESEEKGF